MSTCNGIFLHCYLSLFIIIISTQLPSYIKNFISIKSYQGNRNYSKNESAVRCSKCEKNSKTKP